MGPTRSEKVKKKKRKKKKTGLLVQYTHIHTYIEKIHIVHTSIHVAAL